MSGLSHDEIITGLREAERICERARHSLAMTCHAFHGVIPARSSAWNKVRNDIAACNRALAAVRAVLGNTGS